MSPIDLPLILLAVASVLVIARLWSGPSPTDRLVAAELGFALVLSATALLAARLDSAHVLDVAVIVVLVQFVTTAALASLVEREPRESEESE